MKWTRRILVASAATAAMVLPIVVPVARADAPAIGGFQMISNANGISFIYDQPSFGGQIKVITVVVRNASDLSRSLARQTSTFDVTTGS